MENIDDAFLAYQSGDLNKAIDIGHHLTNIMPNEARAWYLLGKIAFEQNSLPQAKELAVRAIFEDDNKAEFYSLLGDILKEEQNFTTAQHNYNKALNLDSNNISALNGQGFINILQGELEQAKQFYQKSAQLKQATPECYNNLAFIALSQNDLARAKYYLSLAIEDFPNHADSYNNLANIQCQEQDLTTATFNYLLALNLDPNYVDAHNNLANLYIKEKNFFEAKKHIELALNINPQHAESLCNAGFLLFLEKDYAKAIEYFTLSLQYKPKLLGAIINLANCYLQIGNYLKASELYLQAVTEPYIEPEIYYNLAVCYQQLNNINEARSYYQKYLEFNPKHINTLLALGVLAEKEDQLLPAYNYYQQAYNIDLSHPNAIAMLISIKQKLCSYDGIEELTQQFIAVSDNLLAEHKLPVSIEPLRTLNFSITAELQNKIAANRSNYFNYQHYPKKAAAKDKITIGYISSDFYIHPIGFLLQDYFKHHNNNLFNINCYHLNTATDVVSEKIKNSCDKFYQFNHTPSYNIAQTIYQDEVDILIDLQGHTGNSKLDVLAFKPAPIIAHFLGYPGSLQANYIDYYISHNKMIDNNNIHLFSEKILYLPDSPFPASYVAPGNSKYLPLPKDAFVFCCLANAWRYNRETMQAWATILHNCPESVLLLKADNTIIEENLRNFFHNLNINDNRLYFYKGNYLSQDWPTLQANVWLDNFSISSGTASAIAIMSQVPVITKVGPLLHQRTASGYNIGANVPELNVTNTQDYIELATSLYKDTTLYQSFQQRLKQWQTMPLFALDKFVHNMENIYQQLLEGKSCP